MASFKRLLGRREFLRDSLLTAAKVGAGLAIFEAGRKGIDLLELRDTWSAAAVSNDAFLSKNASLLDGLELGASFAPEQWSQDRSGSAEAMRALDLTVHQLDIRRIRLGVRWRRGVNRDGAVDLSAYRPYIDYCLANGVDVCMNVGPIRTFRWPEEHVPRRVLERLESVPGVDATIRPQDELAQVAFSYVESLLEVLRRDYGNAIHTIQVENEPFYELGEHRWIMSLDYLREVANRVDDAFPNVSILVTSAGRLNLNPVRNLFVGMLAEGDRFEGRLISGFDYHYKTPLRDSMPIVRHFDQLSYARPLAPSLTQHQRDARALGFRIEVTEGQMEPYGKFTEPGNSAKDFRFLLLRCLEKVLDPEEPRLLRIWGVEELTKHMLRRDLTDEHAQIIELIQTLNSAAHSTPGQVST
jgi:hypothetical protein